jgi:phospholipase/lecithinase/hemolysin
VSLAEKLGLPFLPAYLSTKNSSADDTDMAQGVNFAVGGATAIDVGFFERKKLTPFKLINNSLDVQLGWFEELRPSLCSAAAAGCFGESLFMVGEFGVNDYTFIFSANKTEAQVMRSYVPKVVRTIASAVERLIVDDGAAHVVVPGNPPVGCSPTILTLRRSPNAGDYDRVGCLRDVNNVVRYHNALLRLAVVRLRARHPHATIVFADFYTPIRRMLRNPGHFGMRPEGVLKACCGTGGEYNWNGAAVCGMPGVAACRDPAAYVNWDGVHFTEAVNRYVAEGWLYGPYADPPIITAISSI